VTSVAFYTPEMKEAWKSIPKPFRFTVDIVGHSHSLSIRIYENEVQRMDDTQLADFADYLNEVKHTLESFGAIIWIEGVKGNAPRRV